jgi:ATP-dependent exoDNAse (exonuclease V) alpha subunit
MGGAGTGKTTLLKQAFELIQKAGKEVILVAPSASASRGTLREEGFENAETVSKLLQDKEMQSRLQDNVLFMDEAGLADTSQMAQVLELAEKYNARLVLIGDIFQHSAVNRGESLRVLHSVAGIKTAAVSKIYRQRDEFYRDVVSDLSKGEVKTAFAKLDSMGSIKQIDPLNPHKQLVTDYIDIIKQNKTGLIVSPTRAQGRTITESLREQLRQNKVIGKKETPVAKLSNLNMTEAQKADWRNFEEGQVIQFNQNLPDIKRGSIWAVSKIGDKQIIIADKQGKTCSLPLDRAKDYNVYHKSEIGLSKGDQVRITNNCFDEAGKRLNNGQALEIAGIRGGKTILVNPKSNVKYTLDKEFGHLDHNYCITSYSSQGKTVDTVLVSMPETSLVAADSKQFYVSISRGRDSAIVYTDDKGELLETVKIMKTRQSAIELINNGAHMDYVTNPERRKDNTLEIHKPQISYPKSKQVSYEPEL